MSSSIQLPARWTPLRYHRQQQAIWRSKSRFITAFCGRRSGKTEVVGKRKALKRVFRNRVSDGWYLFAGPTRDQAKRVFWRDLKQMIPPEFVRAVRETDLAIELVWGAELQCVGMHEPERVEGRPIDGIVCDEYASMKPHAYTHHVRPALDTPGRKPGWAFFAGTPEGRNHAYATDQDARDPRNAEWEAYHWPSADIMDPELVELARRELDPLTFQQEYEGSFVNFAGRIYYQFDRDEHAKTMLAYNPRIPLSLCFDFNVDPGVAVVVQDQPYGFASDIDRMNPHVADRITAVLGEVWIPRSSTTPAVCRRLVKDWGQHKGPVRIYGDASGGARGTAQTHGSDWDLVRAELRHAFPDLEFRVPKANPPERARVNSVNSHIKSSDGTVRMLVDPRCKHVIRDLEGVSALVGGSGEINKRADAMLTHVSDALGYYVHAVAPMVRQVTVVEQVP